MNGVVSNIYSRRGEFTQPGQPLVDIIEMDRLKLIAKIEDHDVVWVEVGQLVTLTTSTLPGARFAGTLRRIYPKALPGSRKFEMEIELPNPDLQLRPGFFMIGTITEQTKGKPGAESAGILIVPREAVVERYGQHYCYVVDQKKKAKGGDPVFVAVRTAVEVLPIPSDPRSYQLVRGSAEGSWVVTKGHQHLSERSDVRVTDAP